MHKRDAQIADKSSTSKLTEYAGIRSLMRKKVLLEGSGKSVTERRDCKCLPQITTSIIEGRVDAGNVIVGERLNFTSRSDCGSNVS
jgi:hypothetical protein